MLCSSALARRSIEMGCVRPVQIGFRGSYSALWSPASFWEPEAPLHGRKLWLYMLPSSAQVLLQGVLTSNWCGVLSELHARVVEEALPFTPYCQRSGQLAGLRAPERR